MKVVKVYIALYDNYAGVGLTVQAAYVELLKGREGVFLDDVEFFEADKIKVKLNVEKDE